MVKTFLSYWTRLRMKNKGLNCDESKMTITVASFKKSMEQAYNQGAQDQKDRRSSDVFGGELFGDMFSKGFKK